MTVICPKQFAKPRRCEAATDKALCLLRLAELHAGVDASDAVADDLEKLAAAVDAILRDNPRVMR